MLPLNKHEKQWNKLSGEIALRHYISVETALVRLLQTTRPNKQGNVLSFRATWSDLYRRHFFFARHTLSQMSHSALGLLLKTVPVSLFTQLSWFLLPILTLSDMSVRRSCKVQAAKLHFWSKAHWSGRDGGPLQDAVLCMYEANWASQTLTRRVSHAISHNKAYCQVFQAQRQPGASYVLFVAAYLQKKLNLLRSRKSVRVSGLLTGTSWDWHIICPLHAWKTCPWCQYRQTCKKLEKGSRIYNIL